MAVVRVSEMSLGARVGWFTGPRQANGCREWTGTINSHGYGRLKMRGKKLSPTRFILGLESGDPRVAMHSCDNCKCVEPSHLRIGTYADNTADMMAKGRHPNAAKTHCKRGHEFTAKNTYLHIRPDQRVRRNCRQCALDAARRQEASSPRSQRRAADGW